ncbi:MAG TPA: beta-propeller fold lactonase family protein [Ramlibacter sp.]|nr:beta-propeller fold lactonase family protein [Ramlibacter sp.]
MGSLAFVSCADSGEVRCFAVDDTGRLREQQVLALGGMLMPLAQHPSLPRLYVARRSDPMAVITLSIADDGTLASLHEAALPDSMAYLSCDRQGRWLFSASYGGSLVAVSPIDPDGVAQHSVGTLPTGPNAHCIVPDPANRFVYSTALGADAVHRFRLEPSGLAPTQPPAFRLTPKAGPRHLAFDADGTRLYVLNELDAGLDVLSCDPATGDLQPLQRVSCWPGGAAGAPWAAELRLSVDGTLLLATERRTSTLSVFRVSPQNGSLALLSRTPVEEHPRGMQLTPDGRFVLVAGQASHHLASFALDAGTGAMTACDRVPCGSNPNWVETRDPPRHG